MSKGKFISPNWCFPIVENLSTSPLTLVYCTFEDGMIELPLWGFMKYKWLWDRIFIYLLHSYKYLCFFFPTNIYSFILYNYYATTILLKWIIHTYKLCQSLWRLIFQFFSQVYSIIFFTFRTCYFHQMKMFSKASNNHLYTKQKETKLRKFSKSYTSH